AIDNIPGVPGIGEKGAKGLISQFGSLDGVYENLDKVKPAQRKKLEEHREKAFLSRDLARIKCDLDVNIDFTSLKRQEPDRAKLHDVFSRLEFASLMQEYMPEAPPVEKEFRVATSENDVREFAGEDTGAPLAIWIESKTPDGFDEPIGVSLSVKPAESLIVPTSLPLRELLQSGRLFIAHDAKLQIRRLHAAVWPVPQRWEDTMLMSYVINP